MYIVSAMPRPKTPKSKQRTQTIQVKVTPDQKKTLAAKAQAKNLPVSTWLLNLGLEAKA